MRWRDLFGEVADQVGTSEARVVIEETAGMRSAQLFPLLSEDVPPASIERALGLTARRRAGEPLQHVVGHWSFRDLELVVDGRALVPRPETEVLVGHALRELGRLRRDGHRLLALDLGTGSGAIALALASEAPDLEIIASDRSLSALSLARENRDRLESRRVRLVCGEWYAPFSAAYHARIDLVVANPPYLTPSEWDEAPAVVRDYDPTSALIGGASGLESIGEVVMGAPLYLSAPGALVIEIGETQGEAARALARRAGAKEIAVEHDLAGRDRILVARW